MDILAAITARALTDKLNERLSGHVPQLISQQLGGDRQVIMQYHIEPLRNDAATMTADGGASSTLDGSARVEIEMHIEIDAIWLLDLGSQAATYRGGRSLGGPALTLRVEFEVLLIQLVESAITQPSRAQIRDRLRGANSNTSVAHAWLSVLLTNPDIEARFRQATPIGSEVIVDDVISSLSEANLATEIQAFAAWILGYGDDVLFTIANGSLKVNWIEWDQDTAVDGVPSDAAFAIPLAIAKGFGDQSGQIVYEFNSVLRPIRRVNGAILARIVEPIGSIGDVLHHDIMELCETEFDRRIPGFGASARALMVSASSGLSVDRASACILVQVAHQFVNSVILRVGGTDSLQILVTMHRSVDYSGIPVTTYADTLSLDDQKNPSDFVGNNLGEIEFFNVEKDSWGDAAQLLIGADLKVYVSASLIGETAKANAIAMFTKTGKRASGWDSLVSSRGFGFDGSIYEKVTIGGLEADARIIRIRGGLDPREQAYGLMVELAASVEYEGEVVNLSINAKVWIVIPSSGSGVTGEATKYREIETSYSVEPSVGLVVLDMFTDALSQLNEYVQELLPSVGSSQEITGPI